VVSSRPRWPGFVDRTVPALLSTWDHGGSTNAVIVALGMDELVMVCGRINDRGESRQQVEADEMLPSA
jgi:hypothetical protein